MAGELLGRLGAGHRVFLREHKRRHAGDALIGGVLGLRRDQRHVFIGRKTRADVVGIEPAIDGRLHQHIGVGEIAAIAEIQFHQPLFHLGGFAVGIGPVNQAMAVDRVGLPLDQVRPVREALFIGRGDNASGDALVGLGRAELRGEVFVAADALARHPGIEKERPPADLDRHIRHQRQRVLDAALADVAPWAHHIGDDVDVKRF